MSAVISGSRRMLGDARNTLFSTRPSRRRLSRIRTIMRWCVWILPASPAKNSVLRLLGHDIHRTARARPNLVWNVQHFSMADHSRIGPLNVIKNMGQVDLDARAGIGRLNVISGHPVFMRWYPAGARLRVGAEGKITSRHQLDCSGGLTVGPLATIAGHQTRVMTHSIDISTDAQAAYPAAIGERSFVGTRCLILGGGTLPDRSVLAAGSVLPKSNGSDTRQGLWAGVPAKYKQPAAGAWFDRDQASTTRVLLPDTREIIEDGF